MNVKREILIKTSPVRVWSMLTQPQELMKWAGESVMVNGDTYEIKGASGFPGRMGGSVIGREEGSFLQFTWPLGGIDTTVTVTVQADPQTGSTYRSAPSCSAPSVAT